MNPNAKPFISMTSTTILRPASKNNKNKTKTLDQLYALSSSVAEFALRTLSHKELELKLKAHVTEIIRIPKITTYDFEQSAQIVYHHQTGIDVFELLWDKKNQIAFMDGPRHSWKIPNTSVRNIIHAHFDDGYHINILNETPLLDKCVSSASAFVVHIKPACEELDWK